MIIGLAGFIGAGKSTVASHLVRAHGFTELAFADTLKDVCSIIFEWPRDKLQGDIAADRKWRTIPDDWWAERLNRPGFSPRVAMQTIGTEVLRGHFNDDIWILCLERKLSETAGDVVITDCRFPNEIAMLKRLGASMVRVKRGYDPSWVDAAKVAMDDAATEEDRRAAKTWLELTEKVHPSEYSWVRTEFDHTILNESTFDVLGKDIDRWLKKQRGLYLAKTG